VREGLIRGVSLVVGGSRWDGGDAAEVTIAT